MSDFRFWLLVHWDLFWCFFGLKCGNCGYWMWTKTCHANPHWRERKQ